MQVRGVELFELRVGTGPAAVVLHGGPGAHHDYLRPGFDRLAARRTLVYYDQRGGGRSPVPREVPVGWTEQVADLEALRAAWGLEQLPLVGYSWGGILARYFAGYHPGDVVGLVVDLRRHVSAGVARRPCGIRGVSRFDGAGPGAS